MLPVFTALMMSISLVRIVLPAYSTCHAPFERVVSSLQSQSNTMAARSGGAELCARIIFLGPPPCAMAGARPSARIPARPPDILMKLRRVAGSLPAVMAFLPRCGFRNAYCRIRWCACRCWIVVRSPAGAKLIVSAVGIHRALWNVTCGSSAVATQLPFRRAAQETALLAPGQYRRVGSNLRVLSQQREF